MPVMSGKGFIPFANGSNIPPPGEQTEPTRRGTTI